MSVCSEFFKKPFNDLHSLIIGYDCTKRMYQFQIYNNISILLEEKREGMQLVRVKGHIRVQGVKFYCNKQYNNNVFYKSTIVAREEIKEIVFNDFNDLFGFELNNFFRKEKEDNLVLKKLLSK